MQLSPHFHSSEFDCHGVHCGCGGCGDRMSPILIELLEQLRYNCGGYSLIISSGYRCPVHNAEVAGSASNSQHMHWTAADVILPAGLSFEDFSWYVETTVSASGHKFDGIGLYKWDGFIHVDVRDGGIGAGYRW